MLSKEELTRIKKAFRPLFWTLIWLFLFTALLTTGSEDSRESVAFLFIIFLCPPIILFTFSIVWIVWKLTEDSREEMKNLMKTYSKKIPDFRNWKRSIKK